ncbi:MAG: hypothetical protein IJO06_04875 [Thermoguttaceae bacterium]|nr:hypothetical protein [Thermoguttaceae bacterium]
MEVKRWFFITLPDGKTRQTRDLEKAREAFKKGLQVVETTELSVVETDDEFLTVYAGRKWKKLE